jgi:hypothetical protein
MEIAICYLGWAVDALWLKSRSWIWSLTLAVKTVQVEDTRFHAFHDGTIVASIGPLQRDKPLVGRYDVYLNLLHLKCPDAERAATFTEIGCPQAEFSLHCPVPSLLKNTAPKGGRVRVREQGRP